MGNNLTKKQIKTSNVGLLNSRFCTLMQKGETLPANEITVADARELLWIEDELHGRLIKFVGHDFYPPYSPIVAKEKITSKLTVGTVLKATKAETKPSIKIKFPVVVTNSLGSKAAQFTVEADSKDKANILARKMIRKLGLKGATYKLS